VLGMGSGLGVKVPYRSGWQKLLAKGKGACREIRSEGSRRQSPDLRNTNRIEGCGIRASLRVKAKPRPSRDDVVNAVDVG
jgi:hypothetical protein